MLHFFKLIRYKNLLLLALMQIIFRLGYLEPIQIPLSLWYWQYAMLIASTILIAAGGYVINDIMDQETDLENHPEKVIVGKYISESKAYTLYVTLTIIGVALGFVLANTVKHSNLSVIFVLVATLLYFYSSTLKQIAFVGNLVVASALAFSVIIIGIFDIYPNTFDFNKDQMQMAFAILIDYALFAFTINLVREIIKDCEDVKGDNLEGMKTLPVRIGIQKTSKIAFVLLLLPAIYLFYYIKSNLFDNNLYLGTIYLIVFVLAPIIFCLTKIWTAKEKSDFHFISTSLKWIIFFGILSVAVITYNAKHHG